MPHTNNKKKRNGQKLAGDRKVTRDRLAQTALIRQFHTLQKQIAACSDTAERAALEAQLAKLGGLEAYQAASEHGGSKERGGQSSKWLMGALKELEHALPSPARLLDVGAISGTAYEPYDSVQAVSIDLNPTGPDVLKYDFFDFPVPAEPFHVVCLSLVVNFVGALADRGRMLLHAHDYVADEGLMWLVLPRACIDNSRYMTGEHLEALLQDAGWSKLWRKDASGLTYWLLQARPRSSWGGAPSKDWKRTELRGGANRNNFCIVLKAASSADDDDVEQSRADGGTRAKRRSIQEKGRADGGTHETHRADSGTLEKRRTDGGAQEKRKRKKK